MLCPEQRRVQSASTSIYDFQLFDTEKIYEHNKIAIVMYSSVSKIIMNEVIIFLTSNFL